MENGQGPTVQIKPLKRFKFWADMTPEERAQARREGVTPDEPSPEAPPAPATRPEPTLGVGASPTEVEAPQPIPPAGFRFTPRRPTLGNTPQVYILDENWSTHYAASEFWGSSSYKKKCTEMENFAFRRIATNPYCWLTMLKEATQAETFGCSR